MEAKPREHEGHLDATGLRFTIVVSRFNNLITERLLEGALDALRRHGADISQSAVLRVPGAFDLPVAVSRVALPNQTDAIIALAAVIRGATPHFDYVASEVSKGIAHIALERGVPISFGVLTTDTIEQAIERAGTKAGNKGFDAAVAAIEMANLFKSLDESLDA